MLPEAINSINSSYELFSHLQTKSINSSQAPPRFAENKSFDDKFPGMFIYKPIYKQCTFRGSKFERPAGESSCFDICRFYDCDFENADFKSLTDEQIKNATPIINEKSIFLAGPLPRKSGIKNWKEDVFKYLNEFIFKIKK